MSDSWPRRRLLAILRGATEPFDATELARMTGQHVTTVRFHLDVLTRESLVNQVQQPPRGRGRPRIGYTAVAHSVGYQELALVLADQLGADRKRPLDASVAAGRAWATKIDHVRSRIETLDDAKVVATDLLADLGFGPKYVAEDNDSSDSATIRLTACPLRELARTHSEVVCGVHLGLLRESLDRGGKPGAYTASLHPFVEPELCLARLSRTLDRPAGSVSPQLRDADADVGEQSA